MTSTSNTLAADPEFGPEEAPDAGPDAELRPFVIDAAHHGDRLDRALAALAPEFSRSYLQQLIEPAVEAVQFFPGENIDASPSRFTMHPRDVVAP